MIGVFDSGFGGLTVLQALVARFPQYGFVYLGDHGHAPYGDRAHGKVLELTRAGVEALFGRGCGMVILACNTATAIALRTLQLERPERKVLGMIAPTVEAVTQTPWYVQAPVFPQKFNRDVVLLFGTTGTVTSGVYEVEIAKRCPQVSLIGQACPALVPLIEQGQNCRAEVQKYVAMALANTLAMGRAKLAISDDAGETPHWAILGCTHYPLIEAEFRAALPPQVRILSQPAVMADALEDYLGRHPNLVGAGYGVTLLTSAEVGRVNAVATKMGLPAQFVAL